jgi:hypothetical protein
MVSKHTKILLLVAVASLGSVLAWQNYSQMMYERSNHPPALYYLEMHDGAWRLSGPDIRVPLLINILRAIGTFALLFAMPRLVNDNAHRRRR